MAKDYYKILGVEKNASPEEIKKQFRRLAHQYHPDKQGGDEKKFKEINEAYQILSNSEKRKQYDQFGTTFDQAGAGGMNWQDFARQGGFTGNINFDDFGDMFGDFFGFKRGRTQKTRRGADIQMQLTLDFSEAIFGVKKEIQIYKTLKCPRCKGNKAEPGTKINTCPTCSGSGYITKSRQTILGMIQTQAVCPQCEGEGKIPEQKCSECQGRGVVKEYVKINIDIPAGIDDGEMIKFYGQGEEVTGGQAGDLYIQIKVKKHEEFTREGKDIFSKKQISFVQAVLGTSIDVPTAHGDVVLKIPAGTQNNKVFRLKGKGVPNGYTPGDHFVEIIIAIPKKISRKQKELLKEFEKEDEKKGWF